MNMMIICQIQYLSTEKKAENLQIVHTYRY